MVVQMARNVGAKVIATVGSAEKADLCRRWGVDCVLNYKTDDVPAGVRAFTKDKGVNVWYETQREPDFLRTVPLMAMRGRIIIMAGRQAQPILPAGPFYTRDMSLHGFAMFNATPQEQRLCSEDINRWLGEGKLDVPIGRTFPLSEAAADHRLQEENTLNMAGSLSVKIVLVL
jgi:NADPH:quinone reductase